MKELIRRLVESFGPAGCEGPIRRVIEEEIRPYVDEIRIDKMGNLIATKKGNGEGKRIMLSAHMDEIGVIVTHIDEKGFLRFSNIGGLSALTLLGQRIVFENGTLGVVGREKLDSVKDLTLEKMFIDIGCATQAEAEAKVSIGDIGAVQREMMDFGDNIVAKSLDDRIGCAVLIEVAKQLEAPENDLFFVFSVQEEVGCRGAQVAAYALEPDLGIAVDVTATGDTPEAARMEVGLGKGTAIKVKDRSLVTHPAVKQMMVDLAREFDIKYQMEVLEFGGTDAGAIHLTRAGVPSGVVSIPCRYVHSPSEMVSMTDVNASVSLIKAIVEADLSRWI
ncbi:MAG: M42 family metallopeptidase [Firmicutes bacterium]|nr:M42 family metallopeptidase [Bacillota bacterium]